MSASGVGKPWTHFLFELATRTWCPGWSFGEAEEGGEPDAYLIDEIGKMECCSPGFVAAIERLLGGATLLLVTVALRGGSLIAEVKARRDAEIWEVTRGNRDRLPDEAASWLTARRP